MMFQAGEIWRKLSPSIEEDQYWFILDVSTVWSVYSGTEIYWVEYLRLDSGERGEKSLPMNFSFRGNPYWKKVG